MTTTKTAKPTVTQRHPKRQQAIARSHARARRDKIMSDPATRRIFREAALNDSLPTCFFLTDQDLSSLGTLATDGVIISPTATKDQITLAISTMKQDLKAAGTPCSWDVLLSTLPSYLPQGCILISPTPEDQDNFIEI